MDILPSNSAQLKELKEKYIELVTQGYVENVALETLNFPRGIYLRLMMDDIEFNHRVTEARKMRADYWVSKIAQSLDVPIEKDEVPVERLKFDKLQFLAKADNPEKYGSASKKMDINIDLGQFKLLPPEEAIKSLTADPFAPKVIEAEFVDVKDEDML